MTRRPHASLYDFYVLGGDLAIPIIFLSAPVLDY